VAEEEDAAEAAEVAAVEEAALAAAVEDLRVEEEG
jgi:hypothetical protein